MDNPINEIFLTTPFGEIDLTASTDISNSITEDSTEPVGVSGSSDAVVTDSTTADSTIPFNDNFTLFQDKINNSSIGVTTS